MHSASFRCSLLVARGLALLPALLLITAPPAVRALEFEDLADVGVYGWFTHHSDLRNSDFTPFPAPNQFKTAWTALDRCAIVTAPIVDPDGNIYITTGKEDRGNLHSFDRFGRLRWTHPGIDSMAVISSPILDPNGVLYVSDSDQFWAITTAGQTRWVAPLPAPFVTAFFIKGGLVGGITELGHIMVFHRANGQPAAPTLKLEGTAPSPPPVPQGLWAGLMDPKIIPRVIAGALGFGTLVANTPAVHPNGTRIFKVTGDGILYGIDIVPGSITIAFQRSMGPGSGSSPVVSPDGTWLVVADGEGNLDCYNTSNGALRWTFTAGKSFASPAVAEDGTIYTRGNNRIFALTPNGEVIWNRDYDTLARRFVLPANVQGRRVNATARFVSVLTVSARHVYVQIDFGHPVELQTGGRLLPPRWSGLLVLDRRNGRPINPLTQLRDTGGAVVVPTHDARVYTPHGAGSSSLAFQRLNEFVPPWRRFSDPLGGITALRPAQVAAHAGTQLDFLVAWIDEAILHIDYQNQFATKRTLQRIATQLKGAHGTMQDTVFYGELRPDRAIRVQSAIRESETLIAPQIAIVAQPGWVNQRDTLRADLRRARNLLANARPNLP